jgi:NADH:ubiquinone oxidoreductase subunit 5 (subunit L)/multisubunit Na+/H+ antiporter MnhA subunit
MMKKGLRRISTRVFVYLLDPFSVLFLGSYFASWLIVFIMLQSSRLPLVTASLASTTATPRSDLQHTTGTSTAGYVSLTNNG